MAATALLADSAARRGWRGELSLAFAPRAGRTVLVRRRHRGPLMVQSPFYPEGPVCHTYLLHPPGGMVGGDSLAVDVAAAPGSQVLLTTPASGKVYRSAGAGADLDQHIEVADGAALEWLPAEGIVFDGARCASRTRVDLAPRARLLAWEAWVLGRPASGEDFRHGALAPALEVRVGERPLLVERQRIAGGSDWLDASFGLAGHRASGTLLAWPGDGEALEIARGAALLGEHATGAATLVDGLLVCRVLARGLVPLRRQLEAWWRALRPRVLGLAPVPPRIWAT